MSWRWVSEPFNNDRTLGYCGLAGKPSDVILDEMREAAVHTKNILKGE